MFCFHKYGLIHDGLQCCQKCGKAITAPRKSCNHKWEILEEHKMIDWKNAGVTVGKIYTMKCSVCGDITSRKMMS